MDPFFTIIMPTFNAGAYLREAVQSILEGVDDSVEVIIQDGGSTDGSLALVPRDTRVRIFSEGDAGQADALNKAILKARGRYVGWLNADDIFYRGWDQHVRPIAEAGADIVYGNYDIVDGTGRRLRRYTVTEWTWDRFFDRGCYIWSGAIFLRRALLEEYGFGGNYHFCMDLDLYLRLGRDPNAFHVPHTLSAFRWHDAAKTSTSSAAFFREGRAIRRREAARYGLSFRRRLCANLHSLAAIYSLPLRQTRAWAWLRPGKQM